MKHQFSPAGLAALCLAALLAFSGCAAPAAGQASGQASGGAVSAQSGGAAHGVVKDPTAAVSAPVEVSPTAAPTPEPTPLPAHWHSVTPAKDGVLTLAFTGDVNFADDWYIMQKYRQSGRTDFTQNFSPDLLAEMQSADLLLCNNEFSISERGAPLPGKQFTFRAAPQNAEFWQVMGADLVSLANNHCGDYGPEAFADTLDILHQNGIATVGAGQNLAAAQQAEYYTTGDFTVAFVAATRAEKYIMTPQAAADSPGVLYTYDPAETISAIRTAKASADFVVAYVHFGTEQSTVLEPAQLELATAYEAAGADLIVGAHPHILQGAGWRNDTPVFYSLGNFWFNMETVDTALLKVTVPLPTAAGTADAGNAGVAADAGDSASEGANAENPPPAALTCQLLPCLQSGGRTVLVTDETQKQRILSSLNAIMENGRLDETGILLPQ